MRKPLRRRWEQAGAWDGTLPPAVPVPDEPAKPQRITIADAVKVFLTNRQGAKIAAATLRKYRTVTKQLTDFSDQRGYVMLDQFTSADIAVFYSGWDLGARAKGKRLGTVKWSNGLEQGQAYSGEDLKDFIWVMVYTGLRISDVGLFRWTVSRATRFFSGPRRTAARFSPSSPTLTGFVAMSDLGRCDAIRDGSSASGNLKRRALTGALKFLFRT